MRGWCTIRSSELRRAGRDMLTWSVPPLSLAISRGWEGRIMGGDYGREVIG